MFLARKNSYLIHVLSKKIFYNILNISAKI